MVLASLAGGPKHGYAITQDVAQTMGVRLSAGTLYAVIARLEARGFIEPLPAEDRRRPYRITGAGARELARQSERMSRVASLATERLHARPGRRGARTAPGGRRSAGRGQPGLARAARLDLAARPPARSARPDAGQPV